VEASSVWKSAENRLLTRAAQLSLLCAVLAALVLAVHAPYFGLPYFWDELGQFVPAALDLYHDSSLVPHSAIPNAHPPGVMAYLALVWRIFGYSIPVTRAAMLLLASLAVFTTYLLALVLCRDLGRAPALIAILLLLADPLFYMQSMMAQLDMPAMLFTVVALLLFLNERHAAAAFTCTALVLVKETGAVVPLVLGLFLAFDPARRRRAPYYLAPFVVLSLWFFILWRSTGHVFGDTGFTHYNIDYALHPVRAGLSLLRRVYYLFIADFRWIGSLAMWLAWSKTRVYSTRSWKIVWTLIASNIVLVSAIGGAELERYLLPVVPLIYIAAAVALMTLRPVWRSAAIATTAAGLLAGLFLNPPFPFPFENNLAMVDFVELHRTAAQFLEKTQAGKTIYTAWPLTAALRNPTFGYVGKGLPVVETSDLHHSTLKAIDPAPVDVLVLYSRTWEPSWGVLRWSVVQELLTQFYEYERQMDSAEVREYFGLARIQRWNKRGQWIEIYARSDGSPPVNTVLSVK
jgi:hypothetical protein